MGVHGLWKLLEPSGKPVPLESLENKVLAVDVSIWLHQLVKGFQDSRGSPLPNAHLLGLFHRVCKLLFYRIKPIFVFDGGVPILKKQTILARRQQKNRASNDADRIREQLLKTLIKSKAVRRVLGEKSSREDVSEDNPREDADMFKLPPILEEIDNDSESETESPCKDALPYDSESDSDVDVKPSPHKLRGKLDLHSLDVTSEEFRSLPPDVRHDILSELQETRKQNSWGRLHEMPEESGDFSSFQLGRLLKRRRVQESLEQAEKEMGGKVLSLTELQDLMSAQGVEMPPESATMVDSASRRIASDAATRYLLVTESSIKEPDSGDRKKAGIGTKHENLVESKVKSEVSDNGGDLAPEFHDDWSSDEEFSTNEPESIAQNFTSENNDISQEQILAIIQSQNQENNISGSKSRTSNSAVPIVAPLTTNSTEKIIHQVSFEDNQSSMISDSDSDEFLVVSSAQTPKAKSRSTLACTPKQKEAESKDKNTLEIVISTDSQRNVEDDIFADIFSQPQKSLNVPKSKQMSHDVPSSEDTSLGRKMENSSIKGIMFKESDTEKVPVDIPTKSSAPYTSESPRIKLEENSESESEIKSGPEEVREKVTSAQDFVESDLRSGPASDVVENQVVSLGTSPAQKPENLLPPDISTTELQDMEASLEKEQHSLEAERGRQERLAASITEQMCTEAQELLQLFGLPYIVAPMEAEAQCAFLDAISLTEGTITDDSDIWLFGGRKVYKNFFNQKKHVLQYTASNIQHYFKMSRQQLVQLALLVGSDYTAGLQGVGPVTALEILAAFPADGSNSESVVRGLRRFRDWWAAGRPQRSARTQQLKNKLKDVKFMEGFPSQAVVDAYLKPAVDESSETFSWGKLDVEALRDYSRRKFGWPASKVDEILLPVAKRWMDRKSQRSIDSYFNVRHKLQEGGNKMSIRVQKAIKLMGTENEDENSDIDNPEEPHSISDVCAKQGQKNEEGKAKGTKHTKKRKNNSEKTPVVDRKANHENSVDEENMCDLPVRAPTVPRQRTATGVKRVGVRAKRPVLKCTMESDADLCSSDLSNMESTPHPECIDENFADEEDVNVDQGQKNEKVKTKGPHRTKKGKHYSDLTHPGGRKANDENSAEEEDMCDLPVRAPTVPRQRSATGVKRVGARAKPSVLKCTIKSDANPCDSDLPNMESAPPPESINKRAENVQVTARKKISKAPSKRKVSVQKTKQGNKTRSEEPEAKKSAKSTSDLGESINVESSEFFDPQPGVSGIKRSAPPLTDTPKHPHQENDSSSSTSSSDGEAAELAASLAEVDWQDDPWDLEFQSSTTELADFDILEKQQPRQKLYFGGIRRNKPSNKFSLPQRQNPPRQEGVDDRGLRPGWRTEERLQSRNDQWSDLVQKKSSDFIPQRVRDQQVQEQAKIKAIQVLKASGSMQTARILGAPGRGSKRARGRAKPLRKELAQHNLSESSSSED